MRFATFGTSRRIIKLIDPEGGRWTNLKNSRYVLFIGYAVMGQNSDQEVLNSNSLLIAKRKLLSRHCRVDMTQYWKQKTKMSKKTYHWNIKFLKNERLIAWDHLITQKGWLQKRSNCGERIYAYAYAYVRK